MSRTGRRACAPVPSRALSPVHLYSSDLLDVDGGASLAQLRRGGFGLLLRHAFLDRLRGRLDQVLGLLQAEAGQLADRLDDVDLVGAEVGEDDAELGLLLDRRGGGRAIAASGSRPRPGPSPRRRSRPSAPRAPSSARPGPAPTSSRSMQSARRSPFLYPPASRRTLLAAGGVLRARQSRSATVP